MDTRVAVGSSTLPFTPVSLLFRDIKYIVPVDGGERTLLNGVSGYCVPGTLTALMGSSGLSVPSSRHPVQACVTPPRRPCTQ